MKEKMRRIALLLSAALLNLAIAVPVFADEIYEPVPGDYRNIVPWLIIIIGSVIANLVIAGVVLIIVFSIRKKKRKNQEQKK